MIRPLAALALVSILAVSPHAAGASSDAERAPSESASAEGRPTAPLEGGDLAGERLDFRVRWGAITAGYATFEAEKVGRERLRFALSVRTTPFVDAFYRVRDRLESTVFRSTLRAIRYEKRTEEGKRRRHELVRYHREPPHAVYTRDGAADPAIETPTHVVDPLAALYAFRLAALDRSAVELDVSDGRRSIRGEVAIVGRETIETPAGRFETLRVEPRLDGVGGVFRRSPGAKVTLWLTDDRFRRPVRLESEVAVGAFIAELVAAEHGDWRVGEPDAVLESSDPPAAEGR